MRMHQAGLFFEPQSHSQLSKPKPNILLTIIIMFGVLFSVSHCQASISVNPVIKTINANTVYQFTIADSVIRTISSTSAFIQISFPSALFTLNTAANYTCANTDTPSTTYQCKASTTNVIQINNPQITAVVFKVSISSIKNPSSTEQATFGYVFRYTNNNTIISQNTTDVFRGYTPGSLISCSASFNPNTVHSTSEITISIVLGNEVKKNGSIFVSFPSVWSDSASSAFPPIITTATQACTRRSTNNFLLSTLSCTTVAQQVLLSNSLSNTAPSGSSLSFSISNILSPPTINSGNSIIVTTLTETYVQIDRSTCIIDPVMVRTISGINPSVQLTVGIATEFIFDFLAPTPITSGDRMIISAVNPNDAFFSLSSPGSVDLFNNALSLTIETSNSTSLTLVFPAMSSVIGSSTTIKIIQGFFVKPLISSGTKQLSLTLRRGSSDYASSSFPLTIAPNLLMSPSILLSTSAVSSIASYTFVMTTSNILAARSRVVMTLPSQLSVGNGLCSTPTINLVSNPSSLNSSLSCTISSNRIITLAGLNTNPLPVGQKINITINNILNSQTTQTTNIFTINTYYGETITDPTDFSSTQTVTMTAATIGVANVTSLLPMVAQDTTYTIAHTVKTKFLANAKLRIGLPAEVSLGATLSTTFSITHTNTTVTPFQSCLFSILTLNSVQYLDLAGISSVILPASTIITIRIATLVNPSSLRPSSSFRLIQIDSKGYEVERMLTGLSITNTLTNSFPILFGSEDPVRMNGETVIYTLNIKSSVIVCFRQIDLFANDYLEMALNTASSKNSQIFFSNPITSCDIFSVLNGVKNKLTSTVQRISSQLLRVNLGQAMLSSQTYQIAINTIQRPRTQQTPNTLTVRSFKYVSSNFSIKLGSSSFAISQGTMSPRATNTRNIMQSVSLNILTNPSQLLSFQTFSITVLPKIPLLSGDYLVIDIPNLYMYTGASVVTVTNTTNLLTVASQSLCIESAYFCSHFSSDPYKIKVEEFSSIFSSLTSVTVTIKNNLYRSPSTFAFTDYFFKATSFASNNLMIDVTAETGTPSTNLNNARFYLSCSTNIAAYHCMTCTASGLCTSCYQPTIVNGTSFSLDGFKFLTSDSKCLSFCGIGYFIDNSSNLCTKCDSPCNTCETTSTTCLSCVQNITTNKYFSGNKTCLSICPDGFYPDPGNICIRCSTSCATCVTDALTCTSCPSGSFLNAGTKTCVSAVNCPSNTFADSLTNKCSPCHISCSGCVSQSFNCLTCATGYIPDFTSSTFKNCTNLCPPGKVNDTVNGLGCRCQTQCKTCQGTISTCKSCQITSIYKYFYGTTCLISCPQGTYSSVIQATGNDICITCTEPNCKTCDAGNCYQCVGQFALYSGRCFENCPTASALEVENGVRKCVSCSVGCVNCDLGLTKCTSCETGYMREANSTGTFCTTACSSGNVNFNNTICYNSCPDGYQNVAQVCRIKQNNTTNISTITTTGLSKTRQVPFPFIIASFLLLVVVLLSKLVLPTSIVSTLFTTIIGVLEPFSWIVAVIVCLFETSEGQHWAACSIGVYLILATLATNFILNIIAFVFYCKYIAKDSKFNDMINYNEKKVFLGKCPTISVLIMSILTSHKILQLLFSNFLSSRHFSYKLETVKKMVPLNYLLFCSMIPSFLAIAGGCIISYELQNYNVESSTFIASLDMILVTVLGIIASLWVTNRKSEDYEKDITEGVNEKHYTEEILVEGHVEEASQNFQEVFMEQSGIRRVTNDGKSYYYQASRVQRGQSHDNDPLSKRQTVRNPINKSNRKKIRGSNLSDEQSSEALVINEKKKRRDLKDQFSSGDEHNNQDEDGMEVIDLEKKDDQLKDIPLISKIRYPNKENLIKPQELTKMSNQQKKALKEKIESQLDPQQKEKLSILNKEKELKIKKRKQKIQQILKIQTIEKEKLAAEQRAKVNKVKQAVDLLKRKQIKIQQYLLYAQIIKEEEGEYDEESEQEISEIDQKANTIIKGILDEDQQLEEVINLSPKRKILESKSGVFKSKSKQKEKFSPSKQEDQKQLQRSKSRDGKSPQREIEKKDTSKQKTIKKQFNTTNKKPKNQKKNKTKPPNDLQINYSVEDSKEKNDRSYDSEEEPELPKNRSNIIANAEKSRNRSEKQLNFKKGILGHNDIMMIDIGSNRHNRTENQISQFGGGSLEEENGDFMPPNYLRSTEKVEYKKNNAFDAPNRNVYDSELDRETLKSLENPDMDFFNEISPSQFGVQNKKFDYVESEDMPVKPRIIEEINYDNDTTMDRKPKSPTKNDGFDIYQGEELDDQSNYDSKINMNNTMNRSSSDMKDFKSIILRKSMQNEKLKQLEKIYMPKPDKKIKTKRDNSVSRISGRKD